MFLEMSFTSDILLYCSNDSVMSFLMNTSRLLECVCVCVCKSSVNIWLKICALAPQG